MYVGYRLVGGGFLDDDGGRICGDDRRRGFVQCCCCSDGFVGIESVVGSVSSGAVSLPTSTPKSSANPASPDDQP